MARTLVPTVTVDQDGATTAPLAADMTNQNMVKASGDVILRLANTNAAIRTVTIQTPKKVGQLDVAEVAIAVPALTGVVYVGPLTPSIFGRAPGQTDEGNVYLDCSGAGVTYEALRVPGQGEL